MYLLRILRRSNITRGSLICPVDIGLTVYAMYSVFFWIPPVSLRHPEVKVTEIFKKLSWKFSLAVAFFRIYSKETGESKETHCTLVVVELSECLHSLCISETRWEKSLEDVSLCSNRSYTYEYKYVRVIATCTWEYNMITSNSHFSSLAHGAK